MNPMYRTILKPGEAHLEIQKSKFIGYAVPVSSEEEAVAFIESVKKKHRDATHNVPAYLIGLNYEVQRYSDDGEPSGTAGVPILEFLKKAGVINLCVVVTRYFGGVKLGTGGLVRAYTQTAQAALEATGIVEMYSFTRLRLEYDYGLHGKLTNWLEGKEDVLKDEIQYTEKVSAEVLCPESEVASFLDEYIELTSGIGICETLETAYVAIKGGKRC
ncbi:MAG: hypothetical protein PWQ12_852 [Clostridiales bacterium]|jgi:uncharacterized YigZ family protein|nr:hypothetical protein [Clostridiales bacterium]